MEAALRFVGTVVGLGLVGVSGWMLLEPIGANGWWQILGNVSSALLGAVFVLYGVLGRTRFRRVLPGTGRSLYG
jgi:hypothetical protein